MRKQVFITKPGMHRLEGLVENRLPSPDAGVQALEHELERAILVDPEKIAKNVVTMNSRIRIHDLDRNSELVVTTGRKEVRNCFVEHLSRFVSS
jgi:regulator of nucleoside diphosphate kinase